MITSGCKRNHRLRARPALGRAVLLISLMLSMASLSTAASAQSSISSPGTVEQLRQTTGREVRSRLIPILQRYCQGACEILAVNVEVDERISEITDLGFEGVRDQDLSSNLFVSSIVTDIQIDDRVTSQNRARLKSILLNNLQSFATSAEVVWKPITVPQIGQSLAQEESMKQALESRVAKAIDRVIQKYCPETCVLSQVAVDGRIVNPDEARFVPKNQLSRDGQGILRVENIDVEVHFDESLGDQEQERITNLMRARTRFASPVNLITEVVPFPEPYTRKRDRESANSSDPYGLGKLRETLRIFRELAGTKEIVTTNTVKSNSERALESTSEKLSRSSSNSRTTTTESESKSSTRTATSSEMEIAGWNADDYLIYGGAILAGLLLIVFVGLRLIMAHRDSRVMTDAAGASGTAQITGVRDGSTQVPGQSLAVNGAAAIDDETRKDIAIRMKCGELKDELVKIFMDAPKVAKETFSRLLQDEGVEETAKYVHIFGHMIVFELLDDPQLRRELYALTEYYHKSEFDFSSEEELTLLQSLKTRVTANEIRVLTRRQTDKFDFLQKLDPSQVYSLIADEKPQLQSIVLTQLDQKRRGAVFGMYQGQAKVDMLQELCRADAIPKEYLANTAKALHRKIQSRPEFDTENLRSSDILLDLLEKSSLEEQRSLMMNLGQTNPESARAIKLKLITIEMLPYLKDGHLLEIMMGIEREDLMTFLAGTRGHIRNLVLSKAPEELAESWIEDLEHMAGFDEQRLRLVEMKIFGRIRSLANNGVISVLDINEIIFQSDPVAENTEGPDLGNQMVA